MACADDTEGEGVGEQPKALQEVSALTVPQDVVMTVLGHGYSRLPS